MKVLVLVAVLCAAACTSETAPQSATSPQAQAAPDISLFDVAGDSDVVSSFEDRAPAPPGAQPVFVVRSYADPAAFDELLAEAEAQANPGQVIVTVDLGGCVLLTLWARPEPTGVRVGYEFDPGVDCVVEIDYRALFIIDETGTNAAGDWDYSDAAPAVTLERQPAA